VLPWTKILLFFLLLSVYSHPTAEPSPVGSGFRNVVRVVDGDTLVLSPNEKVRLVGVDTPETRHPKKPQECFGKEATEFTKGMVAGKWVRLELQEADPARSNQDKYGRTLGYIYLKDGTFLNAEIVRRGYGYAYTRFPFRYRAEFRELERLAREKALGLWFQCRRLAHTPWLSRNLSASIAAMQPVPAAVTAWR